MASVNCSRTVSGVVVRGKEMTFVSPARRSKKLSEKADTLFKRNLEAQDEIHKKREKILKNRARVSDTRKKIKLFL